MLSLSCCLLGKLLVILQNPTQNHFLLDAFPERPIPTPTASPALDVSVLVLSLTRISTALEHKQSFTMLCLLPTFPSRPLAPTWEGPGFLHFISPATGMQ